MRTILIFTLLISLTACTTSQRDPQIESPILYYRHTVAHSGETLGAISSWYTGKTGNWIAIREHNPHLKVRSIQIGQPVFIPQHLLLRRGALPQRYLSEGITGPLQAPTGSVAGTSIEPNQTLRPKLQPVGLMNVNWSKAGDYLYPDEVQTGGR